VFTNMHRFKYLVDQRAGLGSSSALTVMFGVSDIYLSPNPPDDQQVGQPTRFLDHMFDVWVSRTAFATALSAANGGAGSYKWQAPPPGSGCGTEDADRYVSDSNRDGQFKLSWEWYCRDGKTLARVDPPTRPCPS
jgi:hypothetical protein